MPARQTGERVLRQVEIISSIIEHGGCIALADTMSAVLRESGSISHLELSCRTASNQESGKNPARSIWLALVPWISSTSSSDSIRIDTVAAAEICRLAGANAMRKTGAA